MSFLNLMGNRLKPKEVNEALSTGKSSTYNIGTTEELTNKTYLAKEVFVKIFSAGTHSTSQGQVLEMMDVPSVVDKILSCRLMIDNGVDVVFMADVPVWVHSGKINVIAPVSTSNSIFMAIIEYTKPVSTRKRTKK